MDAKLTRLQGHRILPLLPDDLPALADALVAYASGNAAVSYGLTNGESFVALSGPGVSAVVTGDDWARILPLLEDGLLSPVTDPHVRLNGFVGADEVKSSYVLQRLQLAFQET